jgi:methylmalonyl-CoA mutase
LERPAGCHPERSEGSGAPNAPGSPTLQTTARERRNLFEQLMHAVKYNSLGQISHAQYEVGGEYRRNM